ncbi:50S ribosomal protein L35, partial [Vibrio cholerae]|nr:50S ribosomal protein L35 [Vibrio cholerae]
HATKRHILTKRTTKNKRQLRPNAILPKCELAAVARMLPYA